jgi:hypothetical protein
MGFYAELRKQRWDDHRYYHHSRINQALHLLSALSFLAMYGVIFFDPIAAAMLGWVAAMVLRQAGHFFFEPKGYDEVNQATFEHKEDIKVGYNLFRKVVLLSIWAAIPVLLLADPTLGGLMAAVPDGTSPYWYNVSILWLWLGVAAVLFRTLQLFFVADPKTGIVWMTKILTDPFHDLKMYGTAPIWLARGQLIDPMEHVAGHADPTDATPRQAA